MKNGNQTYIVSQNYTQFPGVVLGVDGAQPVHDKKVKELKFLKQQNNWMSHQYGYFLILEKAS